MTHPSGLFLVLYFLFTAVVRVVTNVFLFFLAGMLMTQASGQVQYMIYGIVLCKMDIWVNFNVILRTVINVTARKHIMSSLCAGTFGCVLTRF